MARYKGDLYVELLDTTLRDGEQTPGVAFTPAEKLEIARILHKLHVDRIEIGSARVSEGERESVRRIIEWSEKHDCTRQLEILGLVDNGKSVEWIRETGCRVINLLCKGSRAHCEIQLKKSPERHIAEIKREIERADSAGLKVNLYLEDWSRGMMNSLDYVLTLISSLNGFPVERFMLCDTLGVMGGSDVGRAVDLMQSSFPKLRFDFHGHNDYGLGTANALAAVRSGISGIHCTINGLGERAGNAPLAQVTVAINDLTDRRVHIVEKELQHGSNLLQTISGKRCAWNMPVVGSDVYTQTCGVHADGDRKGELYCSDLVPERFGRSRDYALGKLAGKASIDSTMEQLGAADLQPELREKVLTEVVRLGDRKKAVTAADLPFIISNVMRTPEAKRLQIVDFECLSRRHALPHARVIIEFDGTQTECSASGDGGYDALVKALRRGLRQFHLTMPKLSDYQVRIPPGGRTDALVETTITWKGRDGRSIITSGVDSDQLVAAVIATEKMLNFMLRKEEVL